MYLLWYNVFMHFYLWLYWFNKLVKHLKFNNMRFLDLTLKLSKPNYPECQIRLSGFPRLIKFGHQHSRWWSNYSEGMSFNVQSDMTLACLTIVGADGT
jgi:hypothetical protein